MYKMKEDATLYVVMKSQSVKSDEIKVNFIHAFQWMRKKLQQMALNKFYIPKTYSEALELAASQTKKLELAEKKIAEDAPKIASYEAYLNTNETFSVGFVSALYGFNKFGRTDLFKWLRDNNYITKQGNGRHPMRRWIKQGLFVVKGNTTQFTPKGIDYIYNALVADGKQPLGISHYAKNGYSKLIELIRNKDKYDEL